MNIDKLLDEGACVTLALTLDSPVDGAQVDLRPLLVRGTVTGSQDVGVTVNGVAAMLDLTHSGMKGDPIPWAAILDAIPGPLTLNAAATLISGVHREATAKITFNPPRATANLFAIPPGGTAPFDTSFRVDKAPEQRIVRCDLDLDGDGIYETSLTAVPEAIPFHYATPGVRIATVKLTEENGRVTISSTAVEVSSFAAADRIIQQRWSAFRALLTAGDVDAALTYFADDEVREKYRKSLQLIRPTLAGFAAEMAVIRPVYIRGDVAHYLLTRDDNGVLHGFPVYFTRGDDGLWKIVQF